MALVIKKKSRETVGFRQSWIQGIKRRFQNPVQLLLSDLLLLSPMLAIISESLEGQNDLQEIQLNPRFKSRTQHIALLATLISCIPLPLTGTSIIPGKKNHRGQGNTMFSLARLDDRVNSTHSTCSERGSPGCPEGNLSTVIKRKSRKCEDMLGARITQGHYDSLAA